MDKQIQDFLKKNRTRRIVRRAVSLLCVVVLVFTMNGMKLYVDALDRIPTCNQQEHRHSSACYDESGNAVCGIPEHVHKDACYQTRPTDDDKADFLEISEVAAGDIVEGVGDLELGDLLINNDLVLDDTLVMNEAPAVEAAVEEIPEYELGEGALLSAILANTNIQLKDVYDVGVVDYDGTQAGLLYIEKIDGDYRIKAAIDFDWVDLGVVLADEVKTIRLTGGKAAMAGESAEETVPSGEVQPAEEEQPVTVGQPTEEVVPVEVVSPADDDQAGEIAAHLEEQPAEEQAEQPAVGQAEEPVEEQTEEPTGEQPVEEQAEQLTEEQAEEPTGEAELTAEQAEQLTEEQAEEPTGEAELTAEQAEQPTEEQAEEPTGEAELTAEQAEEAAVAQPTEEQAEELTGEAEASAEQAEEAAEAQPTEEQTEEPTDEQPEQPAQQLSFPAQSFAGSARNMNVTVTAPEGAFPEGTVMTVSAVYDQDTISDIRDTVNDDFTDIKSVRAVDIAFTYNGAEIEPLLPINVVMSVPEIAEAQSAVVVHVDDEGSAEVIDTVSTSEVAVEMPATSDPEGVQTAIEEQTVAVAGDDMDEHGGDERLDGQSAVQFDADSFSVYAIVITEAIETHYIDAEGTSWKITVGYGQDALIPTGAGLVVSEVIGAEADALLTQAAEALDKERITLARFFDITIVDSEGREVQPGKAVEVRVEMDGNDDTVKAVHFDADGLEVLDARKKEDDSVVFDAESFSVYGIVYTVDFTYEDGQGEAYTYNMAGGESMLLSVLFEKLNIEADLTGSEARFSDDMPEGLVELDPVYGEDGETVADWNITSLAPFTDEYRLIVTLADGREIVIGVTDAQSGTCGTDVTWSLDDEGNLTISGNGAMTSHPWANASVRTVTINEGVTSICDDAFSGASNLTSASLPTTLTSIGQKAFMNCKNLAMALDFTGMANLNLIGANAFNGCSSATGINLSGLENLQTIGNNAFCNCDGVTQVDLHGTDHLTHIGSYAFENNYNLTTVRLPDTLTQIPVGMFHCNNNGKSQLTTVEFSNWENLEVLGERAFRNCNKLEMDLSETLSKATKVTAIGANTFANCTNLTGTLTMSGLTSLGSYAFGGAGISGVNLKDCPMTSMGDHAFAACPNLETLILPDTIETLNSYAFENNKTLKTVGIPESMLGKPLPMGLFMNCSGLTTLIVPEDYWKSVPSIGSRAFYNCSALTIDGLDFFGSAALTSVGAEAFQNCANVKGTLDLSDIKATADRSGLVIDHHAFANSGLTAVTFHDSTALTKIDKCAFENIKTAGSSRYTLASVDFSGCTGLTTLSSGAFKNAAITVADFTGCTSLANVSVPLDNWTESAFNLCYNLEAVIFKGCTAITEIGPNAFNLGDALRLVDLSDCDNLEKIDLNAFRNLKNCEIRLPSLKKVQTIGDYAFAGNTVISGIDLSGGDIRSIGDSAFSGCINLSVLDLTGCDALTTIGAKALEDCTQVKSLVIPSSVNDIASDAFTGCAFNKAITWDAADYDAGGSTLSSSVFAGSTNYTLTVGPNVQTLPQNFLKAIEKAGEVYFPTNRVIELGQNVNIGVAKAPFANFTPGAKIYTDASGVVYRLDEDGTATIVYCNPKPNPTDSLGISSYHVPSAITVDGRTYTVGGIEEKAFACAKDLEYVTFENAKQLTVSDGAFEGLKKLNLLADLGTYGEGFDYAAMRALVEQFIEDGVVVKEKYVEVDGENKTYEHAVTSRGVAATVTDATGLFNGATPTGAFFDTGLLDDTVHPWDGNTVRSSEFEVKQASGTGNPSIQLEAAMPSARSTDDETVYPRVSEDHLYTLLTGEPFGLTATMQGGGTDSTFRVYLAFSSLGMEELPESMEIEIREGDTTKKLTAQYKKIDGLPNTWCLEIPLKGSQTASTTLSFSYPSPTSGEGTLRVWADMLEKLNPTEDEWKKDGEEGQKTYEIPISATPANEHNYLQADWKVNRQDRVAQKGATTAQVSLLGDGDASTDVSRPHDFTVSGFGWTIALPYADPSSARVNKGQDMIVQADVSDDITLPAGIHWSAAVLKAIEDKTYTIVRSGENPYEDHYIMQVDGAPVLYVALPGDAESDAPVFTVDESGQVNVSWKLKNPYKNTDLTQNESKIYFYDGTLVMNLEDVYIDGEKNFVEAGTDGANKATEADFPLTFYIPNTASAVLHYTHSNTVSITSNEKRVRAVADPANLRIGKTRSGAAEMRMGDRVDYTFTAWNAGAGTATQDVTVSDALPARQYIPAAELEKLFRDAVYQENGEAVAYGQYLTVTIQNATRYTSDATPGTAKAIDGHSTVRVYDENTGKLTAGSSDDLTITFADGTYTGAFGTETQTADSIKALFAAFGYHVDADDEYRVEWRFPTTQFRYAGGLTQVFPIGAKNKDTFQMLTHDTPIRYMWDEDIDWEDTVSNTANIYNGETLAYRSGTTSFVIKPEYNIRKYLTRGVGEVAEASGHRYGCNPVADYRVNVYNASVQDGNGRSDLPVTDTMTGAQVVLAPVSGNSGLTTEVVTVDGVDYYVLTPGDYSNVKMQDGHVAAEVTVSGAAPDYTTTVKWYLPDLMARENEDLGLRVMLLANDPDDPDGKPYTDYSFHNIAYLNDRTDDRLYDTIGEGGSSYGMSKKIVTEKGGTYATDALDGDDLSWVTKAGNAPLYRISIDFTPRKEEWSADINWQSIYDELPKTFDVFKWSSDNVAIAKVETVGTVSGTEGVDEIADWQFTKNAETGQWEMRPAGTGKITLKGTSHVYIYVRLTFPEDEWQRYCGEVRGGLISNTAHVGQRSDTVYHEVKTQAKAWLQKGVNYIYNVGTTSSRTEYSNIAGGLEYYTVLYNSGDDRLYLNDFVDTLPRGFHFVRVSGGTRAWQPGGRIDPAAIAATSATSTVVSLENGDQVTFREARLIPRVVTDYAGNETVTFSVTGSGSATLSVLQDESDSAARGLWYLMPGEAIAFAYCVQVDAEAINTSDSAVNTIRMAYNDPAMLGVEVDDGGVTFTGCARSDTDEFNDGTAISYNGGQGIQSNVTVTRGEILPGVAKNARQYSSVLALSEESFHDFPDGNSVNDGFIYHTRWEVDAQNNGTAEINGYAIEETMQSPYRFRGEVNYVIYRYDGNTGTRMLAPYASASATAPGYLFRIISTDDEGVSVMGMNNATVKVPFGAAQPVMFNIPEVRNLVNNTREENLQFGLSFELLADGSEKMVLTFPQGTLPVVPFGFGRLELTTSTATQVSNTEITNLVLFKPDNKSYTLTGDGQLVTDSEGGNVGVRNWDSFICQIGSVTDSEKKVTAKGYDGESITKTSKHPKDNVATLVDAGEPFTYTLEVTNQTSGSMMDRLVIVDNLPQVGDVETITASRPRNSQFQVDFKLTEGGALQGLAVVVNGITLTADDYTVQFCDDDNITQADRMAVTGSDTTHRWYNAPKPSSRSIRIIVRNVHSGQTAQVSFDAVQTGGKPGQIAYNSFAYYYELGGKPEGKGVAAAPRVVGVRIPRFPTITKEVFDRQDSARAMKEDQYFYFLVHRGAKKLDYSQWYTVDENGVPALKSDYNGIARIVKVTVPAGTSSSPVPTPDQLYQYGFWRNGQTYTIVELPTSERFELAGWEIYTGTRKSTSRENALEFVYSDTRTKAFTARNRDVFWDLKVTKTDIETGKPLAGAVFGIYSLKESEKMTSEDYPDATTCTAALNGESETWYLTRIVTTGEDGVVEWKDRQEEYYLVRELKAPRYYKLAGSDYRIIQSTSGEESFGNEPMKGAITVTKKLGGMLADGESEDTVRAFTFNAEFTYEGQVEPVTERFTLYAKAGEIEIEGETVDRKNTHTFEDIPYGTTLTLWEEADEDFTVSMSLGDETVVLDQDGKYTIVIDGENDDLTFAFEVLNTRRSQQLMVKKVNLDGQPIPNGAQFALYLAADYDDDTETVKPGAEPLATGTTGADALWNLGERNTGHYRLVETQAPAGYNRLANAVRIAVTPTGVTYSKGGSHVNAEKDEVTGAYIILVPNTPGARLPSTGGQGTLPCYLGGSLLILCAIAIALERRRRLG